MKKNILLILIFVIVSLVMGLAFQHFEIQQLKSNILMKKVTGIGGIFFKSKDPAKLKEWYQKHLGLNISQYGVSFEWRQIDEPTNKGTTQWSPFPETTKYFEPSSKDFMVNYRVDNLLELVEELKKENVQLVDSIESYEYGKFVHLIDLEGNKIELWEPPANE